MSSSTAFVVAMVLCYLIAESTFCFAFSLTDDGGLTRVVAANRPINGTTTEKRGNHTDILRQVFR